VDESPEHLPARQVSAQGPPLPTRQLMNQWWRDVVFVHWRVDPVAVAPLLPPGVEPDLYDGSAWIGLVPFRMVDAGLGRRGPVPWLGTFSETNVRTYSVDGAGRRGVVFLSLDCDRLAVVVAAVAAFAVPYRWARISYAASSDRVRYETERRVGDRPGSVLEVGIRDRIEGASSGLDSFVTARFGLHTRVAGQTLWLPNTHDAWPLHRAEVLDLDDELVAAAGLPGVVDTTPESVLFSPGVRTVFGRPQRVAQRGG